MDKKYKKLITDKKAVVLEISKYLRKTKMIGGKLRN